ncbi:MAG: efflux RND transporter periplasmic adaptor subunit, partial [Chloroflexi bacterium]|nr:efflux RND transporter periplasmic adaptor subunit [Chloroflexota bacterium]
LRAAEVAAGEQARSLVSGATGQRDALQADLRGATAGVETAARDLERSEGLAAKQIVSQQSLGAAMLAVETAEARVAALREREAAAAAGVESAHAGANLAAAQVDAARAAVHSAEIQLAHTVLTAPTGGGGSRKSVVLGQLVQPGQPLLAIVDPDAVWLTANFKETQLEGIRLDASVDFSVDAYPDCEGLGVVESFAAATGSQFALLPPNNATGNFTKV